MLTSHTAKNSKGTEPTEVLTSPNHDHALTLFYFPSLLRDIIARIPTDVNERAHYTIQIVWAPFQTCEACKVEFRRSIYTEAYTPACMSCGQSPTNHHVFCCPELTTVPGMPPYETILHAFDNIGSDNIFMRMLTTLVPEEKQLSKIKRSLPLPMLELL